MKHYVRRLRIAVCTLSSAMLAVAGWGLAWNTGKEIIGCIFSMVCGLVFGWILGGIIAIPPKKKEHRVRKLREGEINFGTDKDPWIMIEEVQI